MMRLLAAALSAALITQSSGAPGLTSRLDAEIARVQADIARVGPADQREALAERLTRAQQAMAAGRLPLALYELEPAWEAADTASSSRRTRTSCRSGRSGPSGHGWESPNRPLRIAPSGRP